MEQDETSMIDRLTGSGRSPTEGRDRRFRRVPPAVTPLKPADIAAGVAGQRAGTGRDAFRERIVSFLDAREAASYTSFRRALCACLLEISSQATEGQTDVLIPAFSSSDFPAAIEGAGLNALRYDVDAEELSLDMDAIRERSGEDALAVVVVNVLGYGSPMDRIEEYCRENDLYLIEALGYALGSEYEGERLGTFGDCSVLNFQQGKPVPIGGGMVVSRNADVDLDDEGRSAVAPNLGMLAGYTAFAHPRLYYLYAVGVDWLDRFGGSTERFSTHPESKFDVPFAPPFATVSDFQGTVGCRVFDRLEDHRRRRALTARRYATELADCPHVRHVRPVEGLSKHQHVRYPLVVDSTPLRDELQEALADAGVETAALYDWPPIDPERFPEAARLQRGILTLPTHPYVDEDDRRRIVRTVRDVLTSAAD